MDVTMSFKFFDLESQPNCTYDYVSMHAGSNQSWPMLGIQYCGFKLPPEETVTGPMTLFFKSDFDTEYTGFVAEYTTTGN